MELVKLKVNVRCDFGQCKNLATYAVTPDLSRPHVPWRRESGGFYLCRDCMEKLYELIGKEIIPKSPDSLIKKAEKRRELNEKRYV